MSTTTISVTRAKAICSRAVSLVSGVLDSTDHTAPGMWADARKAEAADDRRWYRNNRNMARQGAERDARLVLTMLDNTRYTIVQLYGLRPAHRDAVIIGARHAEKLAALGIDTDELQAACEVLGDARRG